MWLILAEGPADGVSVRWGLLVLVVDVWWGLVLVVAEWWHGVGLVGGEQTVHFLPLAIFLRPFPIWTPIGPRSFGPSSLRSIVWWSHSRNPWLSCLPGPALSLSLLVEMRTGAVFFLLALFMGMLAGSSS